MFLAGTKPCSSPVSIQDKDPFCKVNSGIVSDIGGGIADGHIHSEGEELGGHQPASALPVVLLQLPNLIRLFRIDQFHQPTEPSLRHIVDQPDSLVDRHPLKDFLQLDIVQLPE